MDLEQRPIFKHAVLGGTFDRFHAGHELLLGTAGDIAIRVGVAVSSDAFLQVFGSKKEEPELIQPYETRRAGVEQFLIDNALEWYIQPLEDRYGMAITEESADCIFVSHETYKTAVEINEIREHAGMPMLSIIMISYARDDEGDIVASSILRQQERDNPANRQTD